MSSARDERIDIRTTVKEKKEFEEAAALANMGLSEFIRFATHWYAMKVHQEYHHIVLNREDGIKFLEALENPPEPNKKLRDAMRKHRNRL